MIYFGDELNHAVLNPNQIRKYGIPFWYNLFEKDRVIVTKTSDELDIPVIINAAQIGFMYRIPTK